MSEFSNRFRLLKDESELTLKDLSDELGISVPNLSYYMKGREPSYDILISIANYFNVTTDWLIGRTDTRSSVHDALNTEITNKIISIDTTKLTKEDITPLKKYQDNYVSVQDKIIEFLSFYYTLLSKLEQLQSLHPEYDFFNTNNSLTYNFIEALDYQIDLLSEAQWTIRAATSNMFFEYYFNSLTRIDLITTRYKMFISNILKLGISNFDGNSDKIAVIVDFLKHSENYGQNCISETELSTYLKKLGIWE